MKKLSILVLLFCFNFASAQEDSTVYHNAISSIGMITDKTASVASGFFIDKNIFITNWHVTDHFDIPSGKIKMKDGSRFTIKKIVEENIKKDISIVETNENCSSFLFLNDTFQTGDRVYSIGNPIDDYNDKIYYFTMTKGRVQDVYVHSWYYEDETTHDAEVILHSATIKPGNSGGPLLDSRGDVVGVNAFFYDNNQNYAVHSDELIRLLNKNKITYNKNKEIVKKEKVEEEEVSEHYEPEDAFEYLRENLAMILLIFSVTYYLFTALINFSTIAVILIRNKR